MSYLLGYVIESCLSVAQGKKWFNTGKLKATLCTMEPLPLTQVTQLAWDTTMNFAGCLPLVVLTRHQQQLLSGYKKLVSSLISVCSQCQRYQRGQRRRWRRLEEEEEKLAEHGPGQVCSGKGVQARLPELHSSMPGQPGAVCQLQRVPSVIFKWICSYVDCW